MNGDIALSYGLFPDSSVSTLTKTGVLSEKFFLSENVISSESGICGEARGTGHCDRCFSIFQGDEMKQKENLPPLEL